MMKENKVRHLTLGALALCALAARPALADSPPLAPSGHWSAVTIGHAPTPPMGWNSWNAFGTNVDEAKVIGAAEAIVHTGLAAQGYQYVNIDDGWWLKRRSTDSRMVIRTAIFPSAARILSRSASSASHLAWAASRSRATLRTSSAS